MKLAERMRKPTPRFFRRIRNAGLTLASVGGTILAVPVALPAVVVTAAGYLAVAGAVASAVSQAVTEPGREEKGYSNTGRLYKETDQEG